MLDPLEKLDLCLKIFTPSPSSKEKNFWIHPPVMMGVYTPEELWFREVLSSSSDPPRPLSLADPKL